MPCKCYLIKVNTDAFKNIKIDFLYILLRQVNDLYRLAIGVYGEQQVCLITL